ncbi:MAG: ferredoxin [Acidimicrobiales bacterium]|jgi:ferredoxin
MVEQPESPDPGGVRVAIDRDACMGSGNCVFWAQGVFDLDEDGVAVVVGDVNGREEEVRTAASNCPTSAILFDVMLPS